VSRARRGRRAARICFGDFSYTRARMVLAELHVFVGRFPSGPGYFRNSVTRG